MVEWMFLELGGMVNLYFAFGLVAVCEWCSMSVLVLDFYFGYF